MTKSIISNRIQNVAPSATLQINETVNELRGKNQKIYDLGLGEADYPTPEIVTKVLHEVEKKKYSRYTDVAGTPQLRQSIVKALSTCFHRPPTSEEIKIHSCGNEFFCTKDEIIVSAGSKHLLYSTILALCNPGDEVLLQAPYWVSYPDMVRLADANPVIVGASTDQNFIPPAELIERAITDKTRLVFLNSPNNPTGQVWNYNQLKNLIDVILPHKNVYLLSDEIYGLIVYDNVKHFSPSAISEEMKNRTILTSGLSKAYSMGGWRVGFAAIPNQQLYKAMLKIAANTISSVASITQDASVNAFRAYQRVEEMRKDFQERRNLIYKRLNDMNLYSVKPKGAFYIFPDVTRFFGNEIQGKKMQTSSDVSLAFLSEANIASVPGDAFGNDNHVRFSFVQPLKELSEACDQLEQFTNRYG